MDLTIEYAKKSVKRKLFTYSMSVFTNKMILVAAVRTGQKQNPSHSIDSKIKQTKMSSI